MKSYKQYLTEAVATADIHIVSRLISSYLSKHLGSTVHSMPGLEQFMSNGVEYSGMRYFYGKSYSCRFNWIGKSAKQEALHSVTVWRTINDKYEVTFDHDMSLVRILPQIVSILKDVHPQIIQFVPDEGISEGVLIESADIVDGIKKQMSKMNIGDKLNLTQMKLLLGNKSAHWNMLKAVVAANPHVIDNSGKSPVLIAAPGKINYQAALDLAGGAVITVAKSNAHEVSLDTSSPSGDIEEEAKRVSLRDQIAHMKGFVRLIKSGATNLLIISGLGGIGKCLTGDTKLAVRQK